MEQESGSSYRAASSQDSGAYSENGTARRLVGRTRSHRDRSRRVQPVRPLAGAGRPLRQHLQPGTALSLTVLLAADPGVDALPMAALPGALRAGLSVEF